MATSVGGRFEERRIVTPTSSVRAMRTLSGDATADCASHTMPVDMVKAGIGNRVTGAAKLELPVATTSRGHAKRMCRLIILAVLLSACGPSRSERTPAQTVQPFPGTTLKPWEQRADTNATWRAAAENRMKLYSQGATIGICRDSGLMAAAMREEMEIGNANLAWLAPLAAKRGEIAFDDCLFLEDGTEVETSPTFWEGCASGRRGLVLWVYREGQLYWGTCSQFRRTAASAPGSGDGSPR